MSNLINSVRDYILTCPFLSDWRVNVDYLGTGMEYSIDPLPCDPIIQRYTDGGSKKQFQFAFTSREEYDQDAIVIRIRIRYTAIRVRIVVPAIDHTLQQDVPDFPAGNGPVGDVNQEVVFIACML